MTKFKNYKNKMKAYNLTMITYNKIIKIFNNKL